jgi:DNA invertase Pin-like site-specific DNA recombinase
MALYATARVSTEEQNETRQVERFLKLGVPLENILIEKESGKSTARIKYKSFLKRLRRGDTLYIENIDRLSRDYDGILREWHRLKEMGVIVKVLDTPSLDTDTAINDLSDKFTRDMLLLVQAFQAEAEWQKIKSRQAQGIAVAKASGKKLGRPKSKITKRQIKIAGQYLNREISLDMALQLLKVKRSAFYALCRNVSKM